VSRRTFTLNHRSWDHLQYRGIPVKLHVLGDLPACASPLMADQVWQSYKQQSAEDDNLIPRLIAALEPQDDPGMFTRRGPRKPKGSDPFSDLPPADRLKAEETFARLCRKWEPDLPPWRRAILAGRARRLTLHPPDSEWGRRMRRTKGGVHCQRNYREQGGHALATFNQAMTKRRKSTFDACEGGKQGLAHSLSPAKKARNRLGIAPVCMKGIARVAPILEAAGGVLNDAVSALRYSSEEDARRFLERYDSIPLGDLQHLTIDEICAAAGIDPRRLLEIAVDAMMWISAKVATMQAALSLHDMTRELVRRALTKRGWRERRLFFEIFFGLSHNYPTSLTHGNGGT